MTFLPNPLKRISRFISIPLVAGAIAAGLLLIITGPVSYWVYTARLANERRVTANAASASSDQLRIALIHGLSATQTVALCIEQGIFPREFDAVVPRIARAYNNLDAIELAPEGVVRHVYPFEPNKKAIGFNILTDSLQKDEALLAIQNRSLIFAGPLNLVQGGLAVVGRGPVFLKQNGTERFWGFTIVIIRLSTLIKYAQLDQLAVKGFSYRLSRKDPRTGQSQVFQNNDAVLMDPVAVQVAVPNGAWTLEVAPTHGWRALDETVPTALLSVLLSLLGGAFVWFLARQPQRLKILAEKRAAELLQSEHRFGTLIEEAPVAIVMERGGKILYANPHAHQMLMVPPEISLVGRDIGEFIDPESLRENARLMLEQEQSGSAPAEREMLVIRTDGVRLETQLTVASVELHDGPVHIGFIADITERKRAEQQVRNSLREKELLLKEIHHRVKNNLQVISSLLGIQAQRVTDPVALEAYADSIRRIRSMALVHEKLYRSQDVPQIDYREYLHSVAEDLHHSLRRDGVELRVEAEPIMLGIDVAVPCGLIANELVSNALKHAFPGGNHGTVLVSFKRLRDGMLQLEVQDNGVGFPAALDVRTISSMGMSIIRTLTEQISGSLTLDRAEGTRFTVVFPG
ncbi:MAG: PAS domain S-box protein [Bacteroidetes bacterium]|nr:PAS domain S-box protein [Bacteroidota bacterium]